MNAAAEKIKKPSDSQKERETKEKADQAAKASTETHKDDLLPENDDIVENLIDQLGETISDNDDNVQKIETQKDDLLPDNDDIVQNLIDQQRETLPDNDDVVEKIATQKNDLLPDNDNIVQNLIDQLRVLPDNDDVVEEIVKKIRQTKQPLAAEESK